MAKKIKIPLYLSIIIGMLLGTAWGIVASYMGWISFTIDWIKPWGTIFINLLKLIAVPLIFFSLIKGITSLNDISKLSKLGLQTIIFYISTTIIAITIGLFIVNFTNPGKSFPKEKQLELKEKFTTSVEKSKENATTQINQGPLQFVIDIVPDNIVNAATDNSKMLQIIFFSILIGIAIVLLPTQKMQPVINMFDIGNDIILKVIDLIMKFAPIGVFALLASLIIEFTGDSPSESISLFVALGIYSLSVIAGLIFMTFVIYPSLLRIFTKIKYLEFFKGILPAQLLAFSTSSSAATLPVTMEQCENELNVPKEVSSFVLPIGATINMDGTSMYQAIAAVFIAQAFGMELGISQQLTIILTATLASIGSAAVPGAGIVMLVIVLNSIGVPSEGIALIFAVDRILDMFRTVVNVTGDSTIACIIARKES